MSIALEGAWNGDLAHQLAGEPMNTRFFSVLMC
jgi:hypothetical protein